LYTEYLSPKPILIYLETCEYKMNLLDYKEET
jgi:hypothetical protein